MQIPYLALCSAIMQDLESNNVPFGAMRDLITIIDRTEHEGLSFLTITLPAFYDAVMDGIENGNLDSTLFRGFRKRRSKPVIFSGLTNRMFDDSGKRMDYINPLDVQSLRQICYMFKKINIQCTDERVNNALEQFKQTDKEVNNDQDLPEDLQKVADFTISTLFPEKIDSNTYIPHSGPGAVFENLKGNDKYRCVSVAASIKDYFGEDCIHVSEEWCNADTREVNFTTFPSTRVTCVPKTLKTPRIIAIEPCWTMMFQQGLKDFLYNNIESNDLTAGQVNFTFQTINQDLALLSSVSRSLATIDLSEASDRVSNNQVINLFRSNRSLLDALQATRTGEAELPSGERIDLNKFASMGSATCFPVESLIFFVAAITGLLRTEGLMPTPFNIRKYAKRVWVYGDDIIIPSNTYSNIVKLFTSLGWKVNPKKSFYKSEFRESCGLDAFAGVNVTPTYLRTELRRGIATTPSKYSSLLSTSNLLWEKGLTLSSEFISEFVAKNTKLMWPIRHIDKDSGGLGSFNPSYSRGKVRWNNNLHRIEQYVPTLSQVKTNCHLEGHPALFKTLTSKSFSTRKVKSSLVDDIESQHLESSALRYASVIKHKWVPITFNLLRFL